MCHIQLQLQAKAAWEKLLFAGLLIQYLCETKQGPVLAVDADANSNLE